MHDEVIIADASPLIAFSAIGELELLQNLYRTVTITDIIRGEVHADLPSWIIVSTKYDLQQFQILQLELDPGEASAIALAFSNPNCKIIIDENKGRSVAKRLGLNVIGTIGIIIKAKDQGVIVSGKVIIDKLIEHGFWLSEELIKQVLIRLKE